MKSNKTLNESVIKHALENGLITPKEARHMLKVYLHKSDFTRLPYQKNPIAQHRYKQLH